MGALRELVSAATRSALEKATPIEIFPDGTVRVQCDRCGAVEVPENEITHGWAQGRAFDCPDCGKTVLSRDNL